MLVRYIYGIACRAEVVVAVDLNSIPFQVMRKTKYGVPVLMVLLAEEKAFQSDLVHEMRAEWITVKKAIDFLSEVGYIREIDLGPGHKPRLQFVLTPNGRKVAHIVKRAYDELLQVPATEGHPDAPHRK